MEHSSDSNESPVNDNGILVSKDEFSSELMTSTQQLHPSVTWLFITFIFLYLYLFFYIINAMVDLVGRLQNRYTRGRCISRCDVTEITVAVETRGRCHQLFPMQTATIQKVGCIKPYVMDKTK